MDRIPVGVPEPLIVGRGIDDVAIVALTLSPKAEVADRVTANDLTRVARELRTEIAKIDNVGLTYLVGETGEMIRISPDPTKLALYGVTLQQLAGKVEGANRAFPAGLVRDAGEQIEVVAGETLTTPAEIGNLLLTSRDGRPVYVRDVADVAFATDTSDALVSTVMKGENGVVRVPSVTLAVAKRAGANAVTVAEAILERVELLEGTLIPHDFAVEVTRDYGETANEKANELLYHLGLATVSIIILVWVAIGRREAMVVAVVIPVTILLTLFASRVMGYTLNRVSLFALIFSIGILVDDAIVVIENIARHWGMRDGRDAQAGRDRGGRRGRQPDHRGHADSGRRAAADAVRVGHDGPLHEPDPGQRLGGDDLLLLRRRHGDALADAEDRRQGARSTVMANMTPSAGLAAPMPPSPVRFCRRRRRAGPSCSWSACSLSARWRCSTRRTSRSSCCPSTTSRSCRSSSTCPKARPSRRPTRSPRRSRESCSNCRRCARCRPMPGPRRRSTSTAWCAIPTCAPSRRWATSP